MVLRQLAAISSRSERARRAVRGHRCKWGQRQLREVYAEPFAAAIRDADMAALLCAPVSIDGLPVAASAQLLTDLLREELGFSGIAVAEDGALRQLVQSLAVGGDDAEIAGVAMAAGLDVELNAENDFQALLGTSVCWRVSWTSAC